MLDLGETFDHVEDSRCPVEFSILDNAGVLASVSGIEINILSDGTYLQLD